MLNKLTDLARSLWKPSKAGLNPRSLKGLIRIFYYINKLVNENIDILGIIIYDKFDDKYILSWHNLLMRVSKESKLCIDVNKCINWAYRF